MGNAASAGPEAAEDTTTGGGQRNEVTSVPDLEVAGDVYDDALPKRPTPLEALVLVPRQSGDRNSRFAGDDSDPAAAAAAARKAAEVARATTNVWHMQPPGAMSAGDDDVAKEHPPYLIEAEPAPSRMRVSGAQGKEEGGGTTVGSAEIRSDADNKLPPDAVKPLLEPRLVTPDAASIGDMNNPGKGGDGDEANESNNGTAIGSTADAKETETDVVEEVVAAATNDTTVDAAPNAEKR